VRSEGRVEFIRGIKDGQIELYLSVKSNIKHHKCGCGVSIRPN
jgi:hypothetical protein